MVGRVSERLPVTWDAIIAGMKDGVIVLDTSYCATYANQAALALLGLDAAHVFGKTPESFLTHHPAVLSLYQDLLQLIDWTDSADEAMLGDHDSEQASVFVEMRLGRLKDDQDRVIGYVIVLQDITGRKHAELMAARRLGELTALRLVDERMSSTLDTQDVLNIALSSALRMSSADAGFISLTEDDQQRIVQVAGGYSPEQVGELFSFSLGIAGRAMRTRQPVLVDDVTTDPDYYEDLPETRSLMSIPLVAHDRLIGLLNLEASVPYNFKPEVFEFAQSLARRIAVALENAQLYAVSQQQLAELQTLYDQVKSLEQDKTNIIRLAAHDLRGPVGTIMGYLNLMQIDRDRMDPEHQSWVDIMMELAVRIDTIVADILSLERVHHGAAWEPVNLQELVLQTVDIYHLDARKKNVNLETHITPDAVMVMGDAAQLREAAANLITNAIKYTPSGGSVDVRLEGSESHAVFEVVDTGYGIPEELQSKLFNPFFRVKTEETRKIEGTGLGLHLVKTIIQRHHGQMRFHSVHGEGSMFGFELPLSRE